MPHSINLTPASIEDLQSAMDYYNSRSTNLGFRFTNEVDRSLQAIVKMPFAYGYRHKNVRAKLLNRFPFLIFFIIDDKKSTIEVLRIFNTNQDPFWVKK